jgi:antitoxin YefM
MAVEITYDQASANLEKLMDRVTDDCETIIVVRPDGRRVAIVDADELLSLQETDYLTRSPKNREMLEAALDRARAGEGTPMTLDEIRALFDLTPDEERSLG